MLRIASLFIVAIGCAAAKPPPAPRSAFAGAVARAHAAGTFDGLVVVQRGREVLYRAAVGLADREHAVPHQESEVVRFASVAKQVTAALVMREVERGTVALDAPVQTYLAWASPNITVRQLLQHVSGLPNPDDGTAEDQMPAFYLRTAPIEATVCRQPPKAPPGAFSYNNCDYLILGAMLEKVTQTPFDRLVARDIAGPLGLRHFRIATDATPDDSKVIGYRADGSREASYSLATFGAAGALVGTIDDLVRWAQSLIAHRVVSAAGTAEMFRGDPALHQEALGSWAYELDTPHGKVALVERQGSIGGMRTLLLLAPRENLVIAIVANTEKAELFEMWAKRGLPYDLVVAALAGQRQSSGI